MRLLLILCLTSLLLPAMAQVGTVRGDSTRRPPAAGQYTISAPGGRPTITPFAGPAVPGATLKEVQAAQTLATNALPFVGNLTALQTSMAPTVRYDNYDWVRRAGAVTADNILFVSAGPGLYYERQLPDRRLPPALFGIYPDDGQDDGPGLLAFLNYGGTYELILPAGEYSSSIELTRINRGALTLRGAGNGRTRISFPNNTNGLTVRNEPGNQGVVAIADLSIRSNGNKSGGKEALYLQALHGSGPYKHVLFNLYVESTVVGQEWSTFYHVHNTSQLDLQSIGGVGASLSVTTGLLMDNSPGYPCVEHAVNDLRLYTVKYGVDIHGEGAPAYEGIRFNGGQLVANYCGIRAYSNGYGAPHLALNDPHINTMGGGPCLDIKNFVQVKLTNPVLYLDRNTGVPMPPAAAIFDSPIDLSGALFVNTQMNVADAVWVKGGGGLANLDVSHVKAAPTTNTVRLDSSFTQVFRACVMSLWTGTTTWGTTPSGRDFVGNVARIDNKCAPISAQSPPDGSVMRFGTNNYQWNNVFGHVAAAGPGIAVTTSTTINPAQTSTVLVFGGNPMTLTIDQAKQTSGQQLHILRGDASTNGNVRIKFADSTNFFVQGPGGDLLNSYALPITPGRRSVSFLLTGTHARLLNSGGFDPNTLSFTGINNRIDSTNAALATKPSTTQVATTPKSATTITGLSTVATSGSYTDLLGKPSLFSGSYNDLIGKPTLFSGAYGDLTGRPSLFSGSYLDLTNRPALFSGLYSDLTGKPTLFSGAYNDLTGRPTLVTSYTGLTDRPSLFSGNYTDLAGKPTLFSGSYTDLKDKPTVTVGPQGAKGDPGAAWLVWKGAWMPNTNYAVGDGVQFNGNTYLRTVAGTSGSSFEAANWQQIVTINADSPLAAKLNPSSYDTPSSLTTTKVNDLSTFTYADNYGAAFTFANTAPGQGRASVAGWVTQFRVPLNNAESGRTVEFYILKETATGTFLVTWKSGNVAAEAAGINALSVPLGSAAIGVNDIIAVKINFVSSANSIQFLTRFGDPPLSSGFSINSALTVGTSYTPSAEPTSRRFTAECTIAPPDLLVARNWGNKPNGYAQLTPAGLVPTSVLPGLDASQLPPYLRGTLTPADITTRTGFRPAIGAAAVVNSGIAVDTYAHNEAPNGALDNGNSTFTKNLIVVGWRANAPGLARGGLLTQVRVGPILDVVSGGKIQAWVVRPSSLTGTATFALVQAIGEIDASQAGRWHIFDGLAIQVQAGDLIAVRGVNVNLPFRANNTALAQYVNVRASVGDLTLNAFAAPVSSAVEVVQRMWLVEADVLASSALARNVPNAPATLNAAGNLPPDIGRAGDVYWAGKKIVVVGTSITVGAAASGLVGYVAQAGAMLGANVDNQAVGSSGIVWDGSRQLSLAATQAQLTSAFGAASAQYSYEVKVLGKNADLYVFDHGYNDRTFALGTIDSQDRATFYGAYNVVIGALLAEKPTAQIMFITPHSPYSPVGDNAQNTTNILAIRTALFALAEKYRAPILDFTNTMQLSTSQNTAFLGDGVHPNDEWHRRAGRKLYRFILSL